MVYQERIPAAPLHTCIKMLWYARSNPAVQRHHRILPNGCVQLVINLARDFILDWAEDGCAVQIAPALIVGARPCFEIVHTSDMEEIIGIVFLPGGFSSFCAGPVDEFTSRSVSLEDVWGPSSRTLRDRLHAAETVESKLDTLERHLLKSFSLSLSRNKLVDFALAEFRRAPLISSVNELARQTGWSVRHFSETFRNQVGLSPKVWCRIQRFQRAVKQLHRGDEVHWNVLALDCGYYDQSHFINDFRAFAGINPTTYSARRTQWANHIFVDL